MAEAWSARMQAVFAWYGAPHPVECTGEKGALGKNLFGDVAGRRREGSGSWSILVAVLQKPKAGALQRTPAGVPVEMTSPRSRVIPRLSP